MKKENIRLTLVQADLSWEDPRVNLAAFERRLEALPGRTDLIVLPEMFSTGFTMSAAALAEPMDGPTMGWLARMAAHCRAVITGSFIARAGDRFYNRLVWMRPDGSYDCYDKRHLFTLAGEHKYYAAGRRRLVVELNGWRILPLICYDLRFPVWSRNDLGYDLLLYTANWPDRRREAWKSLLIARAIENQAYTAGVNRIGTDGNGYYHTGDTCLVDYSGEVRYRVTGAEDVFTTTLSWSEQEDFRQKLPFLADRDVFQLPETE